MDQNTYTSADHIRLLTRSLARGWNTWNNWSVASHVLLPDGLSINFGVKDFATGGWLNEVLPGRTEDGAESVRPGAHAYDGSYTALRFAWRGIELNIQTAHAGDDLVALIELHSQHVKTPVLTVECGFLWNRPGSVRRITGLHLQASSPSREISVFATALRSPPIQTPSLVPQLELSLETPIGISTGHVRPLDEIRRLVGIARDLNHASHNNFGPLAEAHRGMQSALAWNTIYDSMNDRVITPVARTWNCGWGGWVLFEWDTYFAAYMASPDSKELAYSNALAITSEITGEGFVPNFSGATGAKSRDRSQPPIGSFVVRELYRKFGELWFLEALFEPLLKWNRWWKTARTTGGLICAGSGYHAPVTGNEWEYEQRGMNDRYGATMETGADDSPVCDDIPFDKKTGKLSLADVGLHSLYVLDCTALADIASVLGRTDEADELRERAGIFRERLNAFWNEAQGVFACKRTDNGKFVDRLSPTSFFPLLCKNVTQRQCMRLVNEHFYNPDEFSGEWMLPSITRNDPAYPAQAYWRGRIWPPYNFLSYLALRTAGQREAQEMLAASSLKAFLQEWEASSSVCENYDAETGRWPGSQSNRFYHWGGLMAFISFVEAGFVPPPEAPLANAPV